MVDLDIYNEESGKTYKISINKKATFSDIISALLEKDINIADESILLTKGKKIEVDKTYDFSDNQKITLRNRKNLESCGIRINFNDVTKQIIQKLKVAKFAKGYEWRTVSPGINLFGICKNKNCKAVNKEVIQIINDWEYDLVEKRGLMECPMCENICITNTVGFYKCYYNIYGTKFNKEKKTTETFGKLIPNFNSIDIINDNYVLIDEQKYKIQKTDGENFFKYDETNGETFFIELKFQVKKF
jgi:hypothetical protein